MVAKSKVTDINAKTDPLAKIQTATDKLTAKTAMKKAADLIEQGDRSVFELGSILLKVEEDALHGEDLDFKAWVAELGLKYRKARYLVDIARTIRDLKIEWKNVEHLGWSKLARVCPILTGENQKDILQDVAEMSLADIEDYVRAYKKGTKLEKMEDPMVRFACKMTAEAKEVVDTAVEKAQKEGNTDQLGVAVEYIAQSYLTGGKTESIETKLKGLTIQEVAHLVEEAHPGFIVCREEEPEAAEGAKPSSEL